MTGKPKTILRKDGEGFAYRSGEKWQLICCDCGLVHDIVLVSEDGMIGVAAKRNAEATAYRRRYVKAGLLRAVIAAQPK